MPGHAAAKELFVAPVEQLDPGASGTIVIDRALAYVGLVSAAAESRTLARPTRVGHSCLLQMKTDGGDITLTVTGGLDELGTTTFTFSDAGQFAEFVSCYDGTNYFWRMSANHAAANLFTSGGVGTFGPAATPASVAATPGTAASTQVTITGGVGGATSIATTGTAGAGGGMTVTLGAGGSASAAATAATGGAGGAYSFTAGAGGAEAVATVTSTAGAGGAIALTTGDGGAVSAAVSGTATGGASGALTFLSGTGGAVTATSGTNVGGASGAVILGSGVGGAASAATDTGGASGAVTIRTGTGGSGDTGGASGALTLQTGAAGAGGSPAVGIIAVLPGAVEKWRFDSVGNLTSLTSSSNVTADGSVVATGGLAFTDVLAAWIDDATHGAGTTTHYIGNQTITTSSDKRVKKNIVPFEGSALAALAKAPQLVSFNYALPGDTVEFGPNSRGRYLGFIAQETIDWAPWAVNAGNAKDCPECRAGRNCEQHKHFWHVEYQHLVPLLVRALQEVTGRLAALEAK